MARILKNKQGRHLLGSGLILDDRLVVTCRHVVENDAGQLMRGQDLKVLLPNNSEAPVSRLLPASDSINLDLAILYLSAPNGSQSRPPMFWDFTAPLLLKIPPRSLHAMGFDPVVASRLGEIVRDQFLERRVREIQVSGGGIKRGHSGGPVVLPVLGNWMCAGIAVLGGEGVATAQIIASDAIVEFLVSAEVTSFLCQVGRPAIDPEIEPFVRAASVLHKSTDEDSIRPDLLQGGGVRFVEFDSHTKEIDASSCEAILRAYNRRCRNEWKNERPRSFIAPRLAIRKTESQVVDRSEVDRRDQQQLTPLLPAVERKRFGKEMAVEQYRRLLETRPANATKRARICVTEDAGSGKSIFTRHLQSVLASESGKQAIFDGEPGLVVRWEGREKSWPFDLRGELENAVAALCVDRSATAEQVVDYAIQNRRVCLILDALDQVTDHVTSQETTIDRSRLLDRIFRFLKSDDGLKCHVVITSRSYAVTQEGDGHRFSTGDWVFATLEGFDERQQRRYLRDFVKGRKWTDFIPCHSVVADLLKVPVILSLIADIGDDIAWATSQPRNQIVLDRLQNRGDLYLRAHEKLAERAAANLDSVKDSDLARWELILSAAAFAMMCDKAQRRNYAVMGTYAVANFRRAAGGWARQIGGEPLSDDNQIKPNDWDTLTLFSQLTKHKSVEKSSQSILSWKHRGWMEYFAGLYLARYASVDAGNHAAQFSNDPDWYWTWRFAIEAIPDVAISNVRVRSISCLFRRPTFGRRPNELIYRACMLLESTNQGCEELNRFDGEYLELIAKNDQVVMEIEASFLPCPPDPKQHSLMFLMGAPESDMWAYRDEQPQREMTVAPFEMSKKPIVKMEFWRYDPGHQHDSAFANQLQRLSRENDCPATFVTWYDAWCFARWCQSRLPTEQEWEYACRAGTTTRFWWGNEFDETKATYQTGHTTAVNPLHANNWGLLEMSGNVNEWCDRWHGKQLKTVDGQDFIGGYCVIRGGACGDFLAKFLRSSSREKRAPGKRSFSIGFRIARNLIGH